MLFQHFLLASFHLNQPLHEAKKNKRYICISRGHMFLCSVFLKTKQKNDEKQNAYFCSIFFYLQKLPSTLDGVIGVYNYVFFV